MNAQLGSLACSRSSSARSKIGEPADSVLAALGIERDSVCEKNPGRKSRERSSSARSKASEPAESVHAALGIEGNSKRMRGPGEKDQEKGAKSDFFEKGDLYKCPCGWCPDTKKKSWVREATRHWRRCQGREKPKMTPETKAQVYGRTSVTIAVNKRKRVIEEYMQWRQTIPNCELREAFCDLEEDRMERRVQKYCTVTMFGCSRCAQVKTCQDAKRSLCSRRSSSGTKNRALTVLKGQAYNAKRRLYGKAWLKRRYKDPLYAENKRVACKES